MRSIFWADPEWIELVCEKPLFGGDGEGDGDPDDVEIEDSEEYDDGDEDRDSDNSDDSDDGDDEDSDDSDEEDVALIRKENRRLRRDLEDAMEMLQDFEAKAELSEVDEEHQSELESITEERDALLALLNGQYVKNAISANSKYDWVDIEDVFNALDADDIDIDIESGDIDGLDDQLAEIAKRKPHWLKQRKRRREEGDSGSTGSGPQGSGRRGDRKKTPEEWAQYNNAYSILTR